MIWSCKKCGYEHKENELEEHHIWCKVLSNPHGYSWKEVYPSRVNLCHKHYEEVKNNIILPILNKYARLLKPSYSESHLWLHIAQIDKPKIIEEVVIETMKWLEVKEDDTKTTTK